MYLNPIVIFSILALILIILVYRVVKSNSSNQESHDLDIKSQSGGIIDIELNDYKDQRLKEVYYSTITNHKTEFDMIHSVDNAIFLKFENDKWLNIMYNSAFELYQIENSNPNELNLEYSLDEMTLSPYWKSILNQKLLDVDLKLEKEETFVMPKDLFLNFESQQVYICFSIQTENKNQIKFGKDWLYIIIGVEQYRKSRV